MKTKLIACAALLMAACCGSPSARKAAATKTEVKHGPEIVLAAPDTVGGTSVNEALANRRSWREYAAAPLTLEELSGVVWAAAGIFRQDHFTHGFDFFTFEEHMFRAAQTNTYSTEIACDRSIVRSIGIRANL